MVEWARTGRRVPEVGEVVIRGGGGRGDGCFREVGESVVVGVGVGVRRRGMGLDRRERAELGVVVPTRVGHDKARGVGCRRRRDRLGERAETLCLRGRGRHRRGSGVEITERVVIIHRAPTRPDQGRVRRDDAARRAVLASDRVIIR